VLSIISFFKFTFGINIYKYTRNNIIIPKVNLKKEIIESTREKLIKIYSYDPILIKKIKNNNNLYKIQFPEEQNKT
jgi:hypothetical protein